MVNSARSDILAYACDEYIDSSSRIPPTPTPASNFPTS
jgi:hypothetical protein